MSSSGDNNPTSGAAPSTVTAPTEQVWVEPPRRNRNLYKKQLEALEWLSQVRAELCPGQLSEVTQLAAEFGGALETRSAQLWAALTKNGYDMTTIDRETGEVVTEQKSAEENETREGDAGPPTDGSRDINDVQDDMRRGQGAAMVEDHFRTELKAAYKRFGELGEAEAAPEREALKRSSLPLRPSWRGCESLCKV